MSNYNKLSISNRCAPVVATDQKIQSVRVWSPPQLGIGMAGTKAVILSCYLARQVNKHNSYAGETLHPVIGDVQNHPKVAAAIRNVEVRAAINNAGLTGLVFRKLPYAGTSSTNSWLTSAEMCMAALIGNWGRVTSDRQAGVYRFERLSIPGPDVSSLPNVEDLIDELLADYVIDSIDHPALQQLLNPAPAVNVDYFGPVTSTASSVEDDVDAY